VLDREFFQDNCFDRVASIPGPVGALRDATEGWTAGLALCLFLSSAMAIISFYEGANHAAL